MEMEPLMLRIVFLLCLTFWETSSQCLHGDSKPVKLKMKPNLPSRAGSGRGRGVELGWGDTVSVEEKFQRWMVEVFVAGKM